MESLRSRTESLDSLISRTSFKRFKNIRLQYLKTLGSTQDFMANVVKSNAEGDVVIAEVQTNGRGSEGRAWISQEGGLWMTITLLPPNSVLAKITNIAARATKRTLEEYGLKGLSIKLPNDVFCKGRKIARLLADTVIQGNNTKVFLGVGINVNDDTSQDSSISEVATSASIELGHEIDLSAFTISTLKNLDAFYSDEIESHESANR